MPAHYYIVKYPYSKFYYGYYCRTCDTAANQSHCRSAAYNVDNRKNYAACKAHCPVSISPACHLYKGIQEISHKKSKNILRKFHLHHLIFIMVRRYKNIQEWSCDICVKAA